MSKTYRVRCLGCWLFIDGNGHASDTATFKTQKAACAAIKTHGVHVSYLPAVCPDYTGEAVLTNENGCGIKKVRA